MKKQTTIKEDMSNSDIAFLEEKKLKIDKLNQASIFKSFDRKYRGDLFVKNIKETINQSLFDKQ